MDHATQPAGPEYPDMEVQLSSAGGNAYHLIGLVRRALRQAGHSEAAATFAASATQSASYDDLLQLIMRTVETT
ncbi:hypothetical protein ABR738_00320 [Streptomyces sp. Edi4]|uniref:hypothetical protein n=1 Tax=Streptomyces sp. Edi4 TaxID=3162527 RepID=UPI0033063BEB